VGRTDLEDVLKKLEKLTNEEIAMASARLLKVTDNIANGVRSVDGNVQAVKGEVQLVGDNVQAVDDKLRTMAEGGQSLFSKSGVISNFYHLDGKENATEVKLVLQQTAVDVDIVKRS
jgi:uncharacterized protein (DUF342 family)